MAAKTKEDAMADLVFMGIAALFFIGTGALVWFLERRARGREETS
jgi:hypothetical protein